MVQRRLARWTLFLVLVAASGPLAPAGAQVRTIATFRVPNPEPGRPRKVVIVRGVELSGLLEMRYEHGCAWLNGVEWLSAPAPHGFMTPKANPDPAELSPAAVKMLQSAPRVIELKHQGFTTNRAIEIYLAHQESVLEHVSARDGPAKGPSPRETAAWLWSRAEGNYQELGRMLELDAPVLALSTADAISFYTGGEASRAFEELDRLYAARSAAERRAVTDSLKVLPPNAALELEQAHAFDR